MAKKTNKSATGTSFTGLTLKTTANKLEEVLGPPTDVEADKAHRVWVCENEQGNVFTIYDWMEPFYNGDTTIEYHIGANTKVAGLLGLQELKQLGL